MNNYVPEGWSASNLGELCIFSGGSAFKEKYQGNNYGDYPFIKVSDMNLEGNQRFITKSMNWINEKVKTEAKIKIFPASSVVFAKVGAALLLNRRRILVRDTAIDNNMMSATPYNEDNYFLFYLLQNVDLGEIVQSGAVPSVNQSQMEDIPVLIPPLPEQKKIAAILTSVDTVIEKTQAQIDKLKDLKTGMMQELLTKGIGHTEFKDSPVGRIPVEWEVVTLADLISSMDGGVSVNSENKQKASGEMGILKTSCVSKGNFYPNENKVVLHNEMDRLKTPVKDDHIIFSRMNTPALVGESGYVNKSYDDLFLPDRLWLIDVYRDKVYVLWLSYILAFNSTRKKITDAATGTSGSMKNISKPSLLSIKIAYPHINEQEKIASILKSVDKKLNKTLHKLSSYQNIKKVLMQDLLTGKVRVKL